MFMGTVSLLPSFKSALSTFGISSDSPAAHKVYEQLLTKICRARVKVFLQGMKESDLQKKKNVAVVDVSLQDKLIPG